MSRTADDYLKLLQQLLPPGRLWDSLIREGSQFNNLMLSLADEFTRVDGRAQLLLNEMHPQLMQEMLTDWEILAGLPECGVTGQTTQQRRNALQAKLSLLGDNRVQYFIDVAAVLGYTVTVTELPPYTYQINGPTTTIIESSCESPCTDPLRIWGNDDLECALKKINPAHLNQSFTYGA